MYNDMPNNDVNDDPEIFAPFARYWYSFPVGMYFITDVAIVKTATY